jgi:hypothetical protein
MKIEDLTPYNYMGHIDAVKSVGWLQGDYPKGETDPKLVEILETYPTKNLCRGFHRCEYCENEKIATGNGEIWTIGKDGQVYASPKMIIHYIKDHNYLPPQEYIDSVLNGVDPNRDEEAYEKAIEDVIKTRVARKSPSSGENLRKIHEQRMVDDLTRSVDKEITERILGKK